MTTKKKAIKKPTPKRKQHQCKRAGCKKFTVYMKRKNGKMEHWCAKHWREDVEIPQGIADRETVRRAKKGFEKRSALKGAAVRASKPKKRVVKRVKS